MLGFFVFQVLASSFWLRWWEISLCCFHPFGYDLGVVLCVLCHDFSHAYSCFDKVFASSFWGRWWEISLCCCHPLEYDLGVVLYIVCHFVHAIWYRDWMFDVFAFISELHFNMFAASHCSYFSQCVGRGQGSAAGAAEDHMTCMLDALKCMGLYT